MAKLFAKKIIRKTLASLNICEITVIEWKGTSSFLSAGYHSQKHHIHNLITKTLR